MSFLYLFLSWHFLLWPHQPAIVPMILDMISWPFRTTWSAGLQQDKNDKWLRKNKKESVNWGTTSFIEKALLQ